MRTLVRLIVLLGAGFFCLVMLIGCVQRRLLYYPSHDDATARATSVGLSRWEIDGDYSGWARVVPQPRKAWLVLHGNAGQAGDRGYVLPHVNPSDAVYIMEYPGYGPRRGSPGKTSFDAAALQAYTAIVKACGVERVIVLGESIGSGPACTLAHAPVPPRHIVLVVPFDTLASVAQEKFSWLPVGLLLRDRWDNIAALKGYTGRLDIYGGLYDQIIPVHHARALAASVPGAHFHEFPAGHNDWANERELDFSEF